MKGSPLEPNEDANRDPESNGNSNRDPESNGNAKRDPESNGNSNRDSLVKGSPLNPNGHANQDPENQAANSFVASDGDTSVRIFGANEARILAGKYVEKQYT